MNLSRMLTDIIPIKDVYALGAEWIDAHGKTLSIITSSLAIVSIISSSTLIWMVLRSPQRLSTTRHRILFGMAVGDIIFSLGMAHYNTVIPSELDYFAWNAHGNQTTCTVSGFITIVGSLMSSFYSCSLNIYSLAIVKYNKTDSYIQKKMEPFLHGVPIAMALAFGFALLATQGYNGSCISPTYYPPHCIGIEDGQVREGFEIPCGRGSDGPSEIIFLVQFSFLVFVSPTTTGVTLGMMYRHVSRQERRMGRYGEGALNRGAPQENNNTTTAASVDGGNDIIINTMRSIVTSVKSAVGRLSSRSNSNQNNSTSRVVMVRARAYTAAFFLTWSWYTVFLVLETAGVSTPVAIIYLIGIFTPLQGFWNLMIFMYPKVMKAKRSQGGNLSWCQATTEAFCPAINRWRERRAAKSDEREISQEDDEKEEIPAGQQQQGDMELVPSSLSRDVCPGSEEEKTETEA